MGKMGSLHEPGRPFRRAGNVYMQMERYMHGDTWEVHIYIYMYVYIYTMY